MVIEEESSKRILWWSKIIGGSTLDGTYDAELMGHLVPIEDCLLVFHNDQVLVPCSLISK